MFLDKWYADAVFSDRLTVLYRARLTLGSFRWGYQGEMRSNADRQGTFSRGSPRDGLPEISEAQDGLRIRLHGAEAIWRAPRQRPFTLWRDGDGFVTWNPVVLNGALGGALSGHGYAERLTMNVMPWKLGLKRLWWGRFCGSRHSLVWIVWEGQHPFRLALLDGAEIGAPEPSAHEIRAGYIRLDIADATLLTRSPLGIGALARMPWPKRLAPVSFLNGMEQKWFGHGRLSHAGEAMDSGSVVCEKVEWP